MSLEEIGNKLVAEGAQQFIDQMSKAGKAVDNFGKETVDAGKKSTQSYVDWGKGIRTLSNVIVGAFSINMIKDFAVDSIKAASDLNETLNKSRVVFGDYADDIEAMGDTAATSMGMSKNEAIAAAATYGNLFTAMNMGKQPAADMSARLVQLAADLGSFNNLPTVEVLDKIRAGLVGEGEPLKTLGIIINETTLKQKAMNLGLSDGKAPLDAVTKAQVAYELMLEQSSNAQGDFLETADGAANSTKILEAQMADLKAEIGKGLLPIWVEMLKTFNEGIATFNLLRTKQEQLDDVVRKHEKEIEGMNETYDDYIAEMKRAISVASGFKNWAEYTRYMKMHNLSLEEVYKSYGIIDRLGWEYIRMQKQETKTVEEAIEPTEEQAEAIDELNDQMGQLASGIPWKALIQNGKDFAATEAESAKQAGLADQALSGFTRAVLLNKMGLEKGSPAWWDMALALGIVSQKEKDTADNIALWDQALAEGKINRDQYIEGLHLIASGIEAIPDSHQTIIKIDEQWSSDWLKNNLYTWGLGNQTFTVKTVYTSEGTPPYGLPPQGPPGHQKGGPVKAGWPYWVGEKGPEPFIPGVPGYILSKSDAERIFARQVQAPSTISHSSSVVNNYNSTNAPAYNLSVMSSQSPAVVQRSFAMMKMLAG